MKKIILYTLLLSTICSCNVTNIISNKSPDYNNKAKKILLIVEASQSDQEFYNQLLNEIYKQLNAKKVSMKGYLKDPLTLDENNIEKNMIEELKPDLIMSIKQTEKKLTTNINHLFEGTITTGATLDIKLFTKENLVPVWRANLQIESGYGLASSTHQAAKQLVLKLVDDKII